ncbi:phosphoribosyltransferase [Gemmatirosa kalamazoonensis]|uniref:Phosphoribosyltransferase n=1 Tax=Gemmatirosa kalamazoonensis TaxID=861299 RepID=W0RDM2_9BACT|nr:phosphoribosyltransferase [Gemmatirosa kalamazoonensis]
MFRDRTHAGRALAESLGAYAGRDDVLVLGMARGGVPVARVVADALGVPLDVAVARKLGVPGIEEVALGAIAEGDTWRPVCDDVAWFIGVPTHVVACVAARERAELARRARLYRGGHAAPDVRGRTVVLVDDGLATGSTLRAAVRALRAATPARLVAAVPAADATRARALATEVDDLVAVHRVEAFRAVSDWYDAFPDVSDAEVLALLGRVPDGASVVAPSGASGATRIAVDGGAIEADVEAPAGARGLVVLAHGGGSSRGSYRNRYVAGRLRLAGFATARVDLLTAEEQAADAATAAERFDVARLARRLVAVCDWAAHEGLPGAHRVALVGASTGAAAALVAATERTACVSAVVSRGGRVDLAGEALWRVCAPTLLLVGGADEPTLRCNGDALPALPRGSCLTVVPGAGHTFEEPGALGAAAEHAVVWLERHALDRGPIRRAWARMRSDSQR